MEIKKLPGTIKVIEVVDNPDGTCNVIFDADDQFIGWFKEKENLKRWSQKRFNKFILEALESSLKLKESELNGGNKS